jgi:hypothetical protein
MKKLIILLAGILFSAQLATAQKFAVSAKSGDTELDGNLDEINIRAKSDLKFFKKDLAVEFNTSEDKVDKIMVSADMSPADAFMTFQIANMTKKDPEIVANSFKVNKDKGWGAIAKEMGIKPGSPEFHALKGKAKDKKDKGGKGKGKPENAGPAKGNGGGKGKGKK